MNIPILTLKGQYKTIKKEVNRAVRKVMDRQIFALGEELSSLEEEVAGYCGTKYAVGCASGTDAIVLALRAAGVGPGDEAITVPFTFFSSAEAISLVGAKPVFTDIDPRTYTMDPAQIEKKITGRTKAIIPVHLYGQCADMDPIIRIAGKRGLKVIEDCAQAFGAGYKNRKSGSMGDMGALSFFPSKNLGAYGEAGMVVTDDKKFADTVRMLRVHGSAVRYMHSMVGYNSRLDEMQAAVLRVKMRYIDRWLEARRRNAQYYNDHLRDLPVTLPSVGEYNVHTYHQYVLKTETADLKRIMKFLTDGGIETRTYYPVPLHLQECYKGLGYKRGDFKFSEEASLSTCAFAVYPELKKKEMDYIISRLRKFFNSR